MTNERAYIVSTNETENGLEVVINHSDCRVATEYAKNYFGDSSTDFRNRNIVSYVCSDFEGNHTYNVIVR